MIDSDRHVRPVVQRLGKKKYRKHAGNAGNGIEVCLFALPSSPRCSPIPNLLPPLLASGAESFCWHCVDISWMCYVLSCCNKHKKTDNRHLSADSEMATFLCPLQGGRWSFSIGSGAHHPEPPSPIYLWVNLCAYLSIFRNCGTLRLACTMCCTAQYI